MCIWCIINIGGDTMKFAKIKQKVGIGTLQLEEKINEEMYSGYDELG